MSLERGLYRAILGSLIIRLRERAPAWTQIDLCTNIGVSRSTLSRIESGRIGVDHLTFEKLAKTFSMSSTTLHRRVLRLAELYAAVTKTVAPKRIPSREAERKLVDYVVMTSA